MPAPFRPSAFAAAGKSMALPIDATRGRKPCCSACVQNVVKSGGRGTPVTICAPPERKREIWLEKSSLKFGYRPGSMIRYPARLSGGGKPSLLSLQALPSPSLGQIAPTPLFVWTCLHMRRKTPMMSSRPQKKWYVYLNGFCGSPLRPRNQGCHGATDEMQGTLLASHVSETGLV